MLIIPPHNYDISYQIEKIRIAECSEDYYTVCTDSDGKPYSCEETDYYSIPLSPVFTVKSYNSKITQKGYLNFKGDWVTINTISKGNFIYPFDPPQMYPIPENDEDNVDSIIVKTNKSFSVIVTIPDNLLSTSISESKYLKVLELRNKELLIKVGVVNSIILDVIAN